MWTCTPPSGMPEGRLLAVGFRPASFCTRERASGMAFSLEAASGDSGVLVGIGHVLEVHVEPVPPRVALGLLGFGLLSLGGVAFLLGLGLLDLGRIAGGGLFLLGLLLAFGLLRGVTVRALEQGVKRRQQRLHREH